MIAEIKIGRDANLYAQIVGTPRPESFKIRRLGLLLWGPSISAFPDDVTPMEVYRGQAAIQLSA